MSNSLDPEQAQQNVGPDLSPNCLKTLSADKTRGQRINAIRFTATIPTPPGPTFHPPSHQRSSPVLITWRGSPISIAISSLCRGINWCIPRCVTSRSEQLPPDRHDEDFLLEPETQYTIINPHPTEPGFKGLRRESWLLYLSCQPDVL